MESQTPKRLGGSSPRDLLSSRSGSLALAALIAVIAGIIIFAYVESQDDEAGPGASSGRVLVAKSLIPKGTSGEVIASQELATATSFDEDQVKAGAIGDPAALAGLTAKKDIYPGQQITTGDFSSTTGSLAGKLTGDQRGIAVPVDQIHGLQGNVSAGDRVDVFVGYNTSNEERGGNAPVIATILENILVLNASGSSEGDGEGEDLILRVEHEDAARLAHAADNGKVWVALRPPSGAKPQPKILMDLRGVLAGSRPITDR